MTEQSTGWRDELLRLHRGGWDADDIDEACEALHDACTDGLYDGIAVRDLTPSQVRTVLEVDLDPRVLRALQSIAVVRARRDADGLALQEALYDLDAFAYEFAGES